MSRRMRFALLASVLCAVAVLAVGCGGSSSETPPPLLPDPTSASYTGPRMPSAADDVAAPAPAPAEPEDQRLDEPRRPGKATWGTGKAQPASEPKMTSPTALPPASASAVPAGSKAK